MISQPYVGGRVPAPYVGGRIRKLRSARGKKAGFIKKQHVEKVIKGIRTAYSKGKELYSKYKHYIDPTIQYAATMYKTYKNRNRKFESGVHQEPNSNIVSPAVNMNDMPIPIGSFTNPAALPAPERNSAINRMGRPRESRSRTRRPRIVSVKTSGGNIIRGPIA